MPTGAIRSAIIVALIGGSVVVIDRAFPQPSSSAVAASSTRPATGTTAPPASDETANNNGGGQGSKPSPQVQGVRIAVYNGTYTAGLAAETASTLEKRFDYKIDPNTSILDAQAKPWDQTTIYYVSSGDKIEAQALATNFFGKLKPPIDAKITKLPSNYRVPSGTQLAVYIGTDFVAATT